jgi:hypothetical protein
MSSDAALVTGTIGGLTHYATPETGKVEVVVWKPVKLVQA